MSHTTNIIERSFMDMLGQQLYGMEHSYADSHLNDDRFSLSGEEQIQRAIDKSSEDTERKEVYY